MEKIKENQTEDIVDIKKHVENNMLNELTEEEKQIFRHINNTEMEVQQSMIHYYENDMAGKELKKHLKNERKRIKELRSNLQSNKEKQNLDLIKKYGEYIIEGNSLITKDGTVYLIY
jgi:acetate kinase